MRMHAYLTVAALILLLFAPAAALSPEEAAPDSTSAVPDVPKPGTDGGQEVGGCLQSGAGLSYFQTCISNTGNVYQMVSPAGTLDNIASEGYALCSSSGTYVSWGFGLSNSAELGFLAPTTATTSSNVRMTSDGRFRVSQTFLRDTVEKELIITMTVRNMLTVPVTGVYLSRFVDPDIQGATGDYAVDTLSSVFIFDPDTGNRGVLLSALTYVVPGGQVVSSRSEGISTFNPLTGGCTGGSPPGPAFGGTAGDWTGRVTYYLGTLNAGASKIVKFVYRML